MDILSVCLIGIGVVFTGLICIIILCYIMSAFCKNSKTAEEKKAEIPAPAAATAAPIQNKQEVVAAIAAAVAEVLGTDVSALRILSIKKI